MTTKSAPPATPRHFPSVLGSITRANLPAGTLKTNSGVVPTLQLTKSAGTW